MISQHHNDRHGLHKYLKSWEIEITQTTTIVQAFAAIVESAKSESSFTDIIYDHIGLSLTPQQFLNCLEDEPGLDYLSILLLGNHHSLLKSEHFRSSYRLQSIALPIDKTLLFNALHQNRSPAKKHPKVVQLADRYQPIKLEKPLDILLGSHNSSNREKITRILKQNSHQVFCVQSGTEMLHALDSHHFDLAILEAELPDMQGIDLIKIYRFSRLDKPWIPFIPLFSTITMAQIAELESAGIAHHLAKPIETQTLMRTVSAAQGDKCKTERQSYNPYSSSNQPASRQQQTLDLQRIAEIEQLVENHDFMQLLINEFENENDATLRRMQLAILENDYQTFHDLGHELRDCAGNIGAIQLYQLSLRAIRLMEVDFNSEANLLLEEMQNAYQESLSLLKKHIGFSDNSLQN